MNNECTKCGGLDLDEDWPSVDIQDDKATIEVVCTDCGNIFERVYKYCETVDTGRNIEEL